MILSELQSGRSGRSTREYSLFLPPTVLKAGTWGQPPVGLSPKPQRVSEGLPTPRPTLTPFPCRRHWCLHLIRRLRVPDGLLQSSFPPLRTGIPPSRRWRGHLSLSRLRGTLHQSTARQLLPLLIWLLSATHSLLSSTNSQRPTEPPQRRPWGTRLPHCRDLGLIIHPMTMTVSSPF